MARITKIYTKTGDEGQTGLVGGDRLGKDAARIEAVGTVDELSSALGLARAFNLEKKTTATVCIDTLLERIQNELFQLGAELATLPRDAQPGMPHVERDQVAALEKLIDDLNAELGPLEEFILPAGSKTAAALHLARTVCRRAERVCVRLGREEGAGEFVVPYLNRLSDALFVLARWANKKGRVKETPWEK